MDKQPMRDAIERYGVQAQLTVAIEELSELTKELCKYKRGIGRVSCISEEMADVYIVLAELEMIFDNAEAVKDWQDLKVKRLKGAQG